MTRIQVLFWIILIIPAAAGQSSNELMTFSKHIDILVDIDGGLVTRQGDFLIWGTKSKGNISDLLVYKTTATGKKIWSRTYKLPSTFFGTIGKVIETSSGDFIVVGRMTTQDLSNTDPFILKLNSQGVVRWSKTIAGQFHDFVNSVIETSDGGYILAGSTTTFSAAGASDAWVFKVNATGQILWSFTFGRSGEDTFFSITATTDHHYVLTGSADILGTTEFSKVLAVKIDQQGGRAWENLYYPPNGSADGFAAIPTENGATLIAGDYVNPISSDDSSALAFKINSNGKIEWKKIYGKASEQEVYFSANSTLEGGFILSGDSLDSAGLLVKLNSSGKIVWSRKFGSNLGGRISFAAQTPDGGFIMAGEYPVPLFPDRTNFLHAVIKTDSIGKISGCNAINNAGIRSNRAQLKTVAASLLVNTRSISTRSLVVRSVKTTFPSQLLCN